MTLLRKAVFLVSLSCVPLMQAQTVVGTPTLTLTTIDVPGAVYTGVWGINKAGEMVGNYGQNTLGSSHGFLYSNGTFTYFDYPGETVTVPTGINDSGLIVGYAGQDPVVGFLYDGTTFTTIKDGADNATVTLGINNADELVGGAGTIYTTKGFEKVGGQFRTLNVKGQYVYVYATGINNLGTIVGWTDTDGFKCRNTTCQSFAFPGASKTEASGINDSGIIVGWYNPSSSHDYAFVLRNGKYISFSYPGTLGTYANEINASGQIVGQYTFDFQAWHGFVTSPVTTEDFERPGCCRVSTVAATP